MGKSLSTAAFNLGLVLFFAKIRFLLFVFGSFGLFELLVGFISGSDWLLAVKFTGVFVWAFIFICSWVLLLLIINS